MNFSMCILTKQGLRRLRKLSNRPMNTDSVTKFQMLSKVAVLLEELHRHEMNPQKLLFSGSSSCEHT